MCNNGRRNNQTVEGVGVRPTIDNGEIKGIKIIQYVVVSLDNFYIRVLNNTHHLRWLCLEANPIDLLELYDFNKRNGRHGVFPVTTFNIITDGRRQSSVVREVPYQCFRIKQILHQLPVLNGSATKYSHLGRYCTFLLFRTFLFFFTMASISLLFNQFP